MDGSSIVENPRECVRLFCVIFKDERQEVSGGKADSVYGQILSMRAHLER